MNYFLRIENRNFFLLLLATALGAFSLYFFPANISPVNWLHISWIREYFAWSDFVQQHYRETNVSTFFPFFSPVAMLTRPFPLLLLLPLLFFIFYKRFYLKSHFDLNPLAACIPLLVLEPFLFFLVLPCVYFQELSGVLSKIGKVLLFPVSAFTDLPLSLFIFLLTVINLVIYALIGFSPLLDLFLSSKAAVFRHTVYFTTFKQTFSLEKVAPLIGLWVFLTPLILNVPRKKTVFLILFLSSPVFLMDSLNRGFYISLFLIYCLYKQAQTARVLTLIISGLVFILSTQGSLFTQIKPVILTQNKATYILPATTPGNEFVFREFDWTQVQKATITWTDLQWIPESSDQAKKILQTQSLEKVYKSGFVFLEKEKNRQDLILSQLKQNKTKDLVFLIGHDQTYNLRETKPYTVGYKFREQLCKTKRCKVIWNSKLN